MTPGLSIEIHDRPGIPVTPQRPRLVSDSQVHQMKDTQPLQRGNSVLVLHSARHLQK